MERVVGRERELDQIAGLLDLDGGGPLVLLLEGEAGIGKTTVWIEGTTAAVDRGYRVLRAQPVEAESAIPFGATADLLADVWDEVAGRIADPQRYAIEIALALAEPSGPPQAPQAIAFGFLAALRALASVQPTLVAVDDIQWLDPPSATMLRYAARRLGDEPIRLLLTRRSDAADAADGDWALGPGSEGVVLGPLSLGAIQRMFNEQLNSTVARSTLQRIHAVAGGNAFHALELGRALAREGDAVAIGEPLPVPESVDALVHQRLEALPPATVAALQVAALCSAPTQGLVEAATSEPVDLTTAIAASVVTLENGEIAFSHPLISSGISAQMNAEDRRDAHRRLTEHVLDPQERAMHLALSRVDPDADVAGELEVAADAARARGSPAASAALLDHSLRLTPPGDSRLVGRVTAAADAHFEAGDTERAQSLLDRLTRELPPGAERAEVIYRLAVIHGELVGVTSSVALYEQALGEPDVPPLLGARIHGDLAWLSVFASNTANGLREAEQAVALTDGVESQLARAEALTALSFAKAVAGEPTTPGLLDPPLALEASGERFRIDRSPSVVAGNRRLWGGDFGGARERFHAVRRLALERGDETNLSIAGYYLTLVETFAADFSRASDHVREAAQYAGYSGVNQLEVAYAGALLNAHLGHVGAAVEAARGVLDASAGAADRMHALRALGVLGFVHLSVGQPSEAHEHLSRAVELSREIGLGEPGLMRFVPDEVEALVALDLPDEAGSALADFEQAAQRLGHPWALASADRSRGLVQAVRGDVAAGLVDLERARDAYARLPMPFEHARTLLSLGIVQRRDRQRGDARRSLEAARATFDQLGATSWAERARSELGRIGGRLASPGTLTTAEERIAGLVAEGKSNKEVAATLFIAVKTVEVTLTRVYRKLGVKSRAELAARFAEVAKQ